MSRSRLGVLRRKEPLRIGFLPVSDCAPLVYAQERGLFAKYDLDVELRCETSCAGIRDKVVEGVLDAAHAPVTLPFLTNVGVESEPCECVAGMVLSLQGNAITLSRQLWDQGARDASALREQIYRVWRRRTYTFGVAFPYSTQYFLLRLWFKSGGIVPHQDVRVVMVPPTQMYPMLKLGYIDGYCVEEPWNSMAVQAGAGVCVATSAELAPLHAEKALMVRQSFALGSPEEHDRLLAALLESCVFCDAPANRAELAHILAQPQYVNAPSECFGPGFIGPFESGGRRIEHPGDFTIFHRRHANDPSDEKATWIVSHLHHFLGQSYFQRKSQTPAPVLPNVFRRDLFERARALVAPEGEPSPASQQA
jgi:ABC-type nitrate/sulfonate/bicarbonate transport system substrate-binding protein